ncbi:uncharacterized protein PG998_000149 [Apiospora kogelbergensis]|uniref:uncharacterized protein n=1 Tax=Apiospora kogelbergensis TaxID=1337665 RepID=UPI0031322D86
MSLYQGTPWTFLLEHMMNVYELQRHFLDHTPQLRQPSMLFFVEAIGIIDMPAFVRGRNTASRGIWAQMRSAQRAQQGNCAVPGGIETPTGLSRSLLHIIADIGDDKLAPTRTATVPPPQLLGRKQGHCSAQMPMQTWSPHEPADRRSGCPVRNAQLHRVQRPPHEKRATLPTGGRSTRGIGPAAPPRLGQNARSRLLDLSAVWGTVNARHAMDMLDEALEADDDSYNMDERARERQVEVALF